MVPVYEYTTRRRKVAELPAPVTTPEAALAAVRPLLDGRETEALVVVALDTKNHPIAAETLYIGHVAGSTVRVGEVFRLAVRVNATSIVVAHCHPSGDPTPSGDDLRVTADILSAGRLLDIELLDHLVVGEGGRYQSLRRLGALTGMVA